MSQENVEIVRRAYAQFDAGRPDPRVPRSGDRVARTARVPRSRSNRTSAHEGVERYIDKVNEAFDDYRMAPEEFIDAGEDRVLVFSREGGRGKGSGAEFRRDLTAHLWTLRNGKAIRMQSLLERSDALEAAGLSE